MIGALDCGRVGKIVAAANSAYLRDLQPLIGRMRDDLLAELVPYLAAHPTPPSHGS